jgi:hypothetical protein
MIRALRPSSGIRPPPAPATPQLRGIFVHRTPDSKPGGTGDRTLTATGAHDRLAVPVNGVSYRLCK